MYLLYLCLVVIVLLLILLIADYILRFISPNYKAAKNLPGSTLYPIIGSTLDLMSLNSVQAFKYLRWQSIRFKQVWREWYFGMIVLNVVNAEDAEIILSSSKHTNKSILYSFLQPFLGTGLLTSEGLKWQYRRKILTPAFHFNILKQMHHIIKNEAQLLTDKLQDEIGNNNGTDVNTLMSRFTLNTICETSMGVKINSMKEPDSYRKTIHRIAEKFIYRLMRPWLYSEIIYRITLEEYNFKKLVHPVHDFTRSVINQRRKLFTNIGNVDEIESHENIYLTKKTRCALLDTLLAAENRGEIDTEGIREEVDTFMFEGHDTTACGLILILLLLAHHPESQERIYEEIKHTLKDNDVDELEPTHYSSMNYLDRVIKESFRIYPPVPLISRSLTEKITMRNSVIHPKAYCHILIYDIHRDPKYFPDPEKFDPDRFLPENAAALHPYAYIPFSAGPRNCIGQKFALLEIKTLLTAIVRRYILKPITKRENVEFIADLVLRTKQPVLVEFCTR